MNTEHPTLSDTLTPLAAELTQVLEAKSELEARERDIKARIRAAVPGPDTYAAGDIAITVSANRRFDPKLAERVVPAELLEHCRIAKVDAAAAREVLPPALYAQCMSEVGDYRVGLGR